MWFQTVILTNASIAGMRKISLSYFFKVKQFFLGLHLLPNSLSMSTGSVFAGWMMHATGRYKTLNLIFGIFPSIGAVLIYNMKEDNSGPIQSWLSIVRYRGFFFHVIVTLKSFFIRFRLDLEMLLCYKLCSV